jgi:hypothetical protein
MVPRPMELLLFTTAPDEAARARDAGVRGVVVDWEVDGKDERQSGFDTEINRGTPADLERLRGVSGIERWCRVNRMSPRTRDEVELALSHGATHILLPMVESAGEVERFLEWTRGRCHPGILVETAPAVERAAELARLPLELVYVGLNDLRISRGTTSIFTAMVDGTVEELRRIFSGVRFGFGGLTVVDGGQPIACLRLLEEMARLRSNFSFLRRSFRRDIAGRDMRAEVARLEEAWQRLLARTPEEQRRDQERLRDEVRRAFGADPRIQ